MQRTTHAEAGTWTPATIRVHPVGSLVRLPRWLPGRARTCRTRGYGGESRRTRTDLCIDGAETRVVGCQVRGTGSTVRTSRTRGRWYQRYVSRSRGRPGGVRCGVLYALS
ncbi:hypothetical protein GCM10009866_13010 [Cellulomonas aerilata]